MPDSGIVKTDKLRNCMFKNNKRDWKEGDTGKTVELDLLLSNIDWAK